VRVSVTETITTAINIAGLVFLGAQVMLARNALKESAKAQDREWDRQRKKSTLDTLVLTSQYREALKAVLPWNDRDPGEVRNFLVHAKGDHGKLAPVREYLNHLVDLSVGVKQGVFDLETIEMTEGGRIIDIVASYRPYIEDVRRELNRPSTYSDVEDLAQMIESLRSKSPATTNDVKPRRIVTLRNLLGSRSNHELPSS
jgi:hypothetical protein